MKLKLIIVLTPFLFMACKEQKIEKLSAQQIINKSINVSGGNLYDKSDISFVFRDREYHYERIGSNRVMKRIFRKDSSLIIDIKEPSEFCRYQDDVLVQVVDSMAHAYSNSINSVHYFAFLPYGLNDKAVKKKLLGEEKIKNTEYYKVQVTFSEEGGGDDFDDVFLYWFNKETYKPDYLAYKYYTDGGGIRFREAYNERYINGIRFVDYNNYKPTNKEISIFKIDSLYTVNELKLLSKIELENIEVETP